MAKQEGEKAGKKKKTKKLLSAQNARSMKQNIVRENPFETIWSRRKFDILGKKRKGEQRRIGLARSVAVEKRKKTLLKEYEQSGKSSVFMDKRIGEKNDDLEEFDKAILRFQRERQLKSSKKSKYNLSDGEEDLSSLSRKDDFEDEMSSDYEDETETKRKSSVFTEANAHDVRFPLETDSMKEDENTHKSKKEVMEEIISKSKFFKAQKAKDKEEDGHLMEQLDKEFTSLAQSEALLSLTQPSKMNALKALLNKSSAKGSLIDKDGFAKSEVSKQEPDAYDRLVKDMVLDMRARPSDRTKTPEEIAQEEREHLEQLEEKRKKRMLGSEDLSDEGSDDHENSISSEKKLKSVSGDDLGDSFSIDEEQPNKKGWVDEIFERKDHGVLEDVDGKSSGDSENGEDDDHEGRDGDDTDQEEGSENDDSDSREILSMKDWEQSDEDDIGRDWEEEEEEEVEEETYLKDVHATKTGNIKTESSSVHKKLSAKQFSAQQESLPFVIEAPKNLEELSLLLDSRSDADVVEAIGRIRACNAIRLAAENRKKMQVFYGVLLQYFAVLANSKPLNLTLLNLLVKPLMEMSVDTPYFAAICARQRILHIRSRFCEDIKDPEKSSWPSLKTLLLLRLWAMIFPCSDFRHVVMTPATLLMCEYLMRCPIVSGQDVAIGSFLCSMVLSVTKQSRKFCPEAIIFLQTLLISASARELELQQQSQWYYFTELKALKPWLCIRNHVSDISILDFLVVMDMRADSPFFSSDSFRASVFVSVIETLRGFVNVSAELSSFPEIFSPISCLLRKLVEEEHIPDLVRVSMTQVACMIESTVDEHHTMRQPLQMRKQKPVPIKLLNPKFEENFVKGRDYDPDRERSERKKLKKRLKREAKGAARELRKDNSFLFEVKERDRLLHEEQRADNYGKARAFLQEQEHAFKSGQLGKGRKRGNEAGWYSASSCILVK